MPRRPGGERREVPRRAPILRLWRRLNRRHRAASRLVTYHRHVPDPASRWRALVLALALIALAGQANAQEPPERRGEYVFHAGGCYSCHTDIKAAGAPLAGGPALATPFGTFHGPNITPDPVHGIGRWSDADFLRAMREGKSPSGQHYYPVFPYTSYTKASDEDLLALKAFLFTQPAVAQPSRPHDVRFPFGWRRLLGVWKWLYFKSERFRPDTTRSMAWNRGAYLVEALVHCGECHTPRDMLGGPDRIRWLAGARFGAPAEVAPNITPHKSQGIGEWSLADIDDLLRLGITPDGDPMTGAMRLVVEHATRKLSPADRQALATYLLALPPLPSAVRR